MELRLGTRGSALALAQAGHVATQLGDARIVAIRTSGDESERDGRASQSVGGNADDKSRFVREIEQALLDGDLDLAVHSAKDVPSELPHGLRIVGVPERAEAADAFVGGSGSLAAVPEGARIGTSSLRRRSQLLAARPDLDLVELRGNVDTRLRRLEAGEYDGLVLAAAGLQRLERSEEISFLFDPAEMTPAAGQGTLALEARVEDAETAARVSALTDADAAAELRAERALVAALDGSCNTPIGARAQRRGERIAIDGYVGLPDGSEWIRDSIEGEAANPDRLGETLAARLSAAGAKELLDRAEEVAA